jgi:hypothetical protein
LLSEIQFATIIPLLVFFGSTVGISHISNFFLLLCGPKIHVFCATSMADSLFFLLFFLFLLAIPNCPWWRGKAFQKIPKTWLDHGEGKKSSLSTSRCLVSLL